jgi:hypothetical protein
VEMAGGAEETRREGGIRVPVGGDGRANDVEGTGEGIRSRGTGRRRQRWSGKQVS